jgi:pilus assembly protein CpaB
MRGLVFVVIGIALAIAGVTFVVVPRLVRAPQQDAQVAEPKQAPTVQVLVAAANLPAGTLIKPDQIRWQAWPEQGVDASFIVQGKSEDPAKTVVAAAVKRGLVAGEPITLQRVTQKGDAGFLASVLTPGMRAVTVKIDAVTGLSGFVLPGDRVDVMLNAQYEFESPDSPGGKSTTKYFAEIVEPALRVLAIDQTMKDVAGATPDEKLQAKVAATATLEVSVKQAERVSVAAQMGKLTLVLTSLAKPDGGERPAELLGWVDDLQVSRFLRAVKSLPVTKKEDAPPPEESIKTRPTMVLYRGTEGTAIGGKR